MIIVANNCPDKRAIDQKNKKIHKFKSYKILSLSLSLPLSSPASVQKPKYIKVDDAGSHYVIDQE